MHGNKANKGTTGEQGKAAAGEQVPVGEPITGTGEQVPPVVPTGEQAGEQVPPTGEQAAGEQAAGEQGKAAGEQVPVSNPWAKYLPTGTGADQISVAVNAVMADVDMLAEYVIRPADAEKATRAVQTVTFVDRRIFGMLTAADGSPIKTLVDWCRDRLTRAGRPADKRAVEQVRQHVQYLRRVGLDIIASPDKAAGSKADASDAFVKYVEKNAPTVGVDALVKAADVVLATMISGMDGKTVGKVTAMLAAHAVAANLKAATIAPTGTGTGTGTGEQAGEQGKGTGTNG